MPMYGSLKDVTQNSLCGLGLHSSKRTPLVLHMCKQPQEWLVGEQKAIRSAALWPGSLPLDRGKHRRGSIGFFKVVASLSGIGIGRLDKKSRPNDDRMAV